MTDTALTYRPLIRVNQINKLHRVAVAAVFFIFGFCFASWASRIPQIQQTLGLSDAQLGMVLFSLPVGLFVSLPLSGWLVANKGSRSVVTIAALLYSVLLVILGLAQSTFQLVMTLFLFGLIGNMGNISMNTQAVGVEALYKRPVMGSFHGIWSLAGFSGAALGSFMNGREVIPAYHFVIVMVISFTIFFIAYRFLLKRDSGPGRDQPLFALPPKSLLSLGLIAFCSLICEGAMFDWSGIYFKKVVQAEPSLTGAGYTAFMSTMAISRFLSDHFAKRFGFKRTIQLSGLLVTAGLLLSVLLPYFYTAIAGFLLVGAGVSSVVPQVYSAAGKSKALSPGLALASVSTIGFLGFLVGPPLIGVLAGISSLRLSFTVIAVMGLCVAVLATITKNKD